MMVLVTDERAVNHRAGPHHPESPERLEAVLRATRSAAVRMASSRSAVRLPLTKNEDSAREAWSAG